MKLSKILFLVMIVACIASVAQFIWVRENSHSHQPIYTNTFGPNTNVSEKDKESDTDVVHTWVINYYANKDGSGAEMLEIKQTTYTDYLMQGVYSTGIQIVNPKELKLDFIKTGHKLDIFRYEKLYYQYRYDNTNNVDYFNSVDGISFDATEQLTSLNNNLYIIDIEGKAYAFDFNKTTLAYKSKSLWIKNESYITSNFDYFMNQIYEVAKTAPKEGVYTDLPIKFSDVFNIYKYNQTSGKFDVQSTFGQIDNYVSFKFNIFDRGAKAHEDSLFNRIGDIKGGAIFE